MFAKQSKVGADVPAVTVLGGTVTLEEEATHLLDVIVIETEWWVAIHFSNIVAVWLICLCG